MKDQILGYVFCESVATETEYRNVKRTKSGLAIIETVLQEAGIPNRNGRIYPKNVLTKSLESGFIKEKLSTSSWLGESNHPSDTSLQRQLNVDMNNGSHFIKQVWWDNKDPNLLIGLVETAYNEIGKNLAGLILENGMRASFSMRGIGDVIKTKGKVTVKDPMRLVTYDLVNYPSHEKAYQRSKNVIHEGFSKPFSMTDMAKYAAEHSSDFHALNEEVLQITNESLILELNESNQLVVKEKGKSGPSAIIRLDSTVTRDIDNFFGKMF